MKKKSSFNSAFTPRLPAAYTKMESQKEDEEDGKNARSRTNRVSSEEGSEDGRREEVAGCCGEGRVWIFLVLGILTLVFSAVLIGIYMNVRSLTSSMDVIEVMPSFVPAASGGLAGLSLLLLFWKRHKVLVYPVLLLCAVCTGLCVIIAVLTGTHVLQPMLSLSTCVYTRKGNICQCLTQFRRDKLELEKAKDGEVVYLTLHDVSSCEDVEDVIPTMLFTMTGIHGLLAIVSTVAGIISFLVYRTERSRKYLEEVDYDDSPPSTPSTNSDNYAEHHTMLPSQPATSSNATTLVNIYTNTNATTTDEDPTNDDGNTTPSDVIYSPADVPMGYAEACRMRRCQSFSQPRRTLRESSPGSSASSQTASSLLSSDKNTSGAEGGGGVRLKEHRKKGRRAVTLHGLDREQLMLILSLQMRYLQESEQSAKKDNKQAADVVGHNTNQIPKTNAGIVSDSSDSSVVFTQLQRRAMTPTPRQERLSSSRTTDDDLDYRPVNLVRSHTPQPFHFKNQQHPTALPPTLSQYQLLQMQQQQLLQLQQQQYFQQQQKEIQIQQQQMQQQQQIQQQQLQKQQQVQQPQLQHLQQPAQQVDNVNEDSDEQPTRITYDLRNVLKTGPIVYENVPSSRASLNYYSPDGSVSSNSSSLIRATNFPIQSGLSPPMQARPLPTPPQSTGPSTSGKVPAAGTAQTSANAQSEAHHQVTETSTQQCSETLASDGKQPGKSKESTPEVQTPKTKSKKKLSKKEKNTKKDEEKTAEAVKPTTLGRTDSNTSKTGPVPDRWQTLMADGTTQVQTLWENVQRKVVSDPQTPDSTLTFPHSSRSNAAAQSANQSFPQGNATPQVIPNGILKNSKSKPYSSYPTQAIVAPQFFGPANKSLQPPYPNPNPVPKSQLFSHHPNEFVPIANSSTDNYEDIEDAYPVGQNFVIPNEPPPKPARLHARNSTKMASTATSGATVDSQDQQLRPKSYLSAVDKEIMANGNLNNLSGFSRPPAQGAEVQSLTHLQMEGPVRDDRNAFLSGPPTDNGEQFILVNGDLYSQPRRKSNPNTTPMNGAPRIYQNTHGVHNGVQPMYRNQYPQGGAHSPQRSAFHTLGHAPIKDLTNPLSMIEACDTDLDDLPAPRWQRRYLRSQSFSPPPYAAPPLYQSLESVNRQSSVRSGSSSSSDPHNSSSDSSTAPKDNMHGAFRGQGQARGRQPAHLTDRRFCITHQRQLQQSLYNAQQQQLQDCPYEEDPGGAVHDAPYMIMRRCQSVEEGNRKRLPQRNGGQNSHDIRNVHPQVDGRFYQNTEPLGYTKTPGLMKYSQYGDTNLTAVVRGQQSQTNVIGGNVGRPTFQNGAQEFQKDLYARTNTGQTRLQQANVVEEDTISNSDNGSNIIEPLTRLGGQANEIVGYVGAVRLTESSDSDKDEYAETVI